MIVYNKTLCYLKGYTYEKPDGDTGIGFTSTSLKAYVKIKVTTIGDYNTHKIVPVKTIELTIKDLNFNTEIDRIYDFETSTIYKIDQFMPITSMMYKGFVKAYCSESSWTGY